MTTDDIKFGHEILGECVHEFEGLAAPNWLVCKKCNLAVTEGKQRQRYRTFTGPRDTFALEQALVRDGKLNEFEDWAVRIFLSDYLPFTSEQRSQLIIDFWRDHHGR